MVAGCLAYHDVNELMNPPMSGPRTGLAKGVAVYIIIGSCNVSRLNRSPIGPPATLYKAALVRPPSIRPAIRVPKLLATAHGINHIVKRAREAMYIGRRP